jgi:3-hydroxy acid dehydrogenase/malonic semialdehyde reductase
VNNAGKALGVKKAWENDIEQMNDMIDTNVKGVVYMLNTFVPAMRQRNRGTIVNISSIAGIEAYPNGSIYCASKFAVNAMYAQPLKAR